MVVRLTWDKGAMLDLVVDEPLGATADHFNPRTVFGGALVKEGQAKRPRGRLRLPRGFDGDYVARVKVVYNDEKNPTAVASLEIVTHEGTADEKVDHQEISLVEAPAGPHDAQGRPSQGGPALRGAQRDQRAEAGTLSAQADPPRPRLPAEPEKALSIPDRSGLPETSAACDQVPGVGIEAFHARTPRCRRGRTECETPLTVSASSAASRRVCAKLFDGAQAAQPLNLGDRMGRFDRRGDMHESPPRRARAAGRAEVRSRRDVPMPARTGAVLALMLAIASVPAAPVDRQDEARALSASFRKAARKVLPAVVTGPRARRRAARRGRLRGASTPVATACPTRAARAW